MRLQTSRFIHAIPVGEGRTLLIHAVEHLRVVVAPEIAAIVDFFRAPRTLPDDYPALAERVTHEPEAVLRTLQALVERGILTETDPDAELARIGAELSASHGRDPAALLERHRREARQGPEPYWAAGAALGVEDLAGGGRRVDLILLGDCDVQMETDFLRREAQGRGLDLRVAATFPDDAGFAGEHAHDAVVIGALRGRYGITDPAEIGGEPPHAGYVAEARRLLTALRAHTAAPILIDNLPEPTVTPLGLAERGADGHRNRFRRANVALAELADEFADVHVIDVAAALAAVGSERLVDDGQVGFVHFGSPGWMLQRPDSEKAAVHDLFPDTAPLAAFVGGDPYGREAVMARAHVDGLVAALAIDRKKCVIVDLDGVLWPGVLAETGAPFAWSPEVSGPFSFIGLYFGLHEALLCLKRRGMLLACVSKNDEATVRALWTYADHYPRERLLTPDNFVTWRVNWDDKVENIRAIAAELGFAEEAFLFIDDHPVERDRVRQRLPGVEVWGEDPFALRRRLLTDPRLQPPRITAESAVRTDLVKAQLARGRARAETLSEADYLATLKVECRVAQAAPDDPALPRVEELFQRTTQFNTTGRRFSLGELQALAAGPGSRVFCLRVADRFGDHGLVGAAVIDGGEILGLAISCRVLGMGVERRFLAAIVAAAGEPLSGRIVEMARNIPVRWIYRDNGFERGEDGVWRLSPKEGV